METKLGTTKCPAIMKKVGNIVTIHGTTVDVYDIHDGGYRTNCPDHPLIFRKVFLDTLEVT